MCGVGVWVREREKGERERERRGCTRPWHSTPPHTLGCIVGRDRVGFERCAEKLATMQFEKLEPSYQLYIRVQKLSSSRLYWLQDPSISRELSLPVAAEIPFAWQGRRPPLRRSWALPGLLSSMSLAERVQAATMVYQKTGAI